LTFTLPQLCKLFGVNRWRKINDEFKECKKRNVGESHEIVRVRPTETMGRVTFQLRTSVIFLSIFNRAFHTNDHVQVTVMSQTDVFKYRQRHGLCEWTGSESNRREHRTQPLAFRPVTIKMSAICEWKQTCPRPILTQFKNSVCLIQHKVTKTYAYEV